MQCSRLSHRLAAAAVALPLSVLVVAACSTSSGSSTSGDVGSAAVAPESSQVAAGSAGSAGGSDAAAAGSRAAVTLPDQKLVRTATLQVTVEDVTRGAAQVRTVAAASGGVVRSEQVGTGSGGPVPAATQSADQPPTADASTSLAQLTIAIPADRLDSVLDQLSRLGTVEQRTSSSQDVTQQHVDTQSRITTMKASIDRLRALMAQATTVDQLVRLETELSQREADLESMQAQLASLDQQVAMSTVTVTLLPQAVSAPAADGGFVAGLQAGWSAFTATLGGLVTFLGLVLPFVGLVLLVGLPGAVWWRRRTAVTGRRTRAVAESSSGTQAAPAQQVAVPAGGPAAGAGEAGTAGPGHTEGPTRAETGEAG